MPDTFTETTTTGLGKRILGSFQWALIGIVLFFGSFLVLYWNEGRDDLSGLARTAVEMSGQTQNADASLQKQLVSVSGIVSSDEVVGDGLYLKPDRYIRVERTVEMYAWVERKEEKTKTNFGGSETTETTYKYVQEWTSTPTSSSVFRYPENHLNPEKKLENTVTTVATATIGIYNFDPQSAQLPAGESVVLNAQNTNLGAEAVLASEQYIFLRGSAAGSWSAPQIGDMRVRYTAVRSGFQGTLFGALNERAITPYFDAENHRLYRVFSGTREEGIATLHTEYVLLLWVLRGAGFCMMWFGLMALFGPVSVFLDILPIAGSISRFIVLLITACVAAALTFLTIIVSMIAHNVLALVLTLVAASALIVAILFGWKKKRASV